MIRIRMGFWLVQGEFKQQFVCSKETRIGEPVLRKLIIEELEIALARQIASGSMWDLDVGHVDLDDTWEIKTRGV